MTLWNRLALAGASVLLLSAWHFPLTLTPPASAPETFAYKFEDNRAKPWLKGGFESSQPTNCAFGAMRFGDNDITPHLPVYLHSMLAERFGDRLAGKTVQLRWFSVHLNKAVEMRRNANMPVFPIFPNVFANAINNLHAKEVGCNPADTFGGYVVGEVESDTPMIVAIDLNIDGQRFRGRAIAPGEELAWGPTVDKLMPLAMKDLGDQIEKGLFAQAPAAAAPVVAQPAETQPAPTAGATH